MMKEIIDQSILVLTIIVKKISYDTYVSDWSLKPISTINLIFITLQSCNDIIGQPFDFTKAFYLSFWSIYCFRSHPEFSQISLCILTEYIDWFSTKKLEISNERLKTAFMNEAVEVFRLGLGKLEDQILLHRTIKNFVSFVDSSEAYSDKLNEAIPEVEFLKQMIILEAAWLDKTLTRS